MAIDPIERLVVQVDDLDQQINRTKRDILSGMQLTANELDLFLDKVARRSLLYAHLENSRAERSRLVRER